MKKGAFKFIFIQVWLSYSLVPNSAAQRRGPVRTTYMHVLLLSHQLPSCAGPSVVCRPFRRRWILLPVLHSWTPWRLHVLEVGSEGGKLQETGAHAGGSLPGGPPHLGASVLLPWRPGGSCGPSSLVRHLLCPLTSPSAPLSLVPLTDLRTCPGW